jgi:hypothetical protein
MLCLLKLQKLSDFVLFILKSFGWFNFISYVQSRATWTLRRIIFTLSQSPTLYEAGGWCKSALYKYVCSTGGRL